MARPATMPSAGSSMACGARLRVTLKPSAAPAWLMLAIRMSLRKIAPKPTGSAMYRVVMAKVMAQATSRRSSLRRFITCSSGGTRIGMKAMCTGISVSARPPATISAPSMPHLTSASSPPA
ncbi:hypothetical protein D3C86_1715740 [compost metagenome]